MGPLGTEWLLALTVALPLALALLALAPPLRGMEFRLAPLAPLPALAVPWLPADAALHLDGILLGTHLGADDITRTFAGFSAFIWLIGSFCVRIMLAPDPRRTRFSVLFLLCMAGNLGMTIAQDMISFYTFYALMGFSAYGLIVHGGGPGAWRAGRIYIYLVILAEIALFAAVVLIGRRAGTNMFAQALDAAPGALAMTCVTIAFAVKAGALPLHFSLPMIYRRAPAAAGLVLAGAMLNAGLLGWLRFFPLGHAALPGWGAFFIGAGLAAAFFGVVAGLFQHHPRALLGYSSISQMGLMTVAVGVGLAEPAAWSVAMTAAIIYALHHALAKSALFLAIDAVPGLPATLRPGGFLILLLPALALGGLPLTSGAVAKAALSEAVDWLAAPWPSILHGSLPLTAVGTTWLVLRFVAILWHRHCPGQPPRLVGVLWLLLVAAVALATWLHPAAQQAIAASLAWPKAWAGLWPVLAGALAAWGWQRFERRRGPIPRLPPGDIVQWGSILVRRLRPLRRRWAVDPSVLYTMPPRLTGKMVQWTQGHVPRWEWWAGQWVVAGTAALTVLLLTAALLAFS